jgi:hypothetical protein
VSLLTNPGFWVGALIMGTIGAMIVAAQVFSRNPPARPDRLRVALTDPATIRLPAQGLTLHPAAAFRGFSSAFPLVSGHNSLNPRLVFHPDGIETRAVFASERIPYRGVREADVAQRWWAPLLGLHLINGDVLAYSLGDDLARVRALRVLQAQGVALSARAKWHLRQLCQRAGVDPATLDAPPPSD